MFVTTANPAPDKPLQLEVEGLSKCFAGQHHALRDVSFTIGRGIFGLLGPNGAGKLTLMNILATLIKPDAGAVLFKGQSALENPMVVRSRLGFLPQSFGVYPRTSARDLLDYLALLKGVQSRVQRRQQIAQALALVHLEEDQHRSVAHFSEGMKRRFGLAQALLGSPQLLIVDEPTAGLDPYERNHFHQIMGDLAKRMVILLSTHLVVDVANLCTQVMILDRGQQRFLGSTDQLLSCLRGKVWTTVCATDALADLKKRHTVLTVRYVAGRQTVHVLADDQPPGFTAVAADLEDAYFAVLGQEAQPC